MEFTIEFVAAIIMIAFIYFKYKTNVAVYGLFAGMISLFLAIQFVAVNIMLVITLGLFAIYLFYDSIFQ